MSYFKPIRANLDQKQFNFLKSYVSNKGFSLLDFDSAQDLKANLESEVEYEFDIPFVTLSEQDFKNLTGYSFEEYDKKVEEKAKEAILEDFSNAKTNDIHVLEDALDEVETSFLKNKLQSLLTELKDLEHDGSKSLGYRKEHILDRKHRRLL